MPLPAILLGLIPNLVDKAVEMIDRKFPTQAEQDAAKAKLTAEMSDKLQAVWDSEQLQLTERHKNDMLSDSWLSKNIRPVVLVYLMVLFTMAFFTDVPESVFELLKNLLMTVFVFYFGSRTIEKVIGMVKGGSL